jgi:DNA-binding transcriptional MerR regulator
VSVADLRLSIGEFAARSHLSPKALRLYDDLGLLAPVQVDPSNGYRWYSTRQLGRAHTVALLRHLDMPLARIKVVLDQPPSEAIVAIRTYWREVEERLAARRDTLEHLCELLDGGTMSTDPPITVTVRPIAERALLSLTRHVHLAEAGAALGAALGRMRGSGPGLRGIEGCPFTIYYGAVTADSDGPVEIARPMSDFVLAQAAALRLGDVAARIEPAHDEAFVRLTMAESSWPAQLPALEAISGYLERSGRRAAGPPRVIMIADWRTAAPDDPACDLAVPLAGPTG